MTQSQRYIEAGSLKDAQIRVNKLKRRRSEYFASAQAAASLDPSQLIREAELELESSLDGEQEQQTFHDLSVARVSEIPTFPSLERTDDGSWSRSDWSVLNKCYRRVKKDFKGKAREESSLDLVSVTKVVDMFAFKMGLQGHDLSGKWDRYVLSSSIPRAKADLKTTL